MIKLTTENVERIFLDCLFKDNELINGKPSVDPVVAEGVMLKVGFYPARLEKHKQDVIELLSQTEREFHADSGGGMSFLRLCNTTDGSQWGEHRSMDQLVVLGKGLGLVEFCLPRDMWDSLPGGMPYIVIHSLKAVAE